MIKKYYKPLFKALILVVGILFFSIPVLCFGADYYVRTNGYNGNDGSADDADHAWLTIAYAESQASPGDTIHIANGAYAESVIINVSGTEGNVITFVGTGTVTIRQIKLVNADYITLNNLTIGWASNPERQAQLDIDTDSEYTTLTDCIIDAYNTVHNFGIKANGSHAAITGTTIKNVNVQTALYLGANISGTTSNHNSFTNSTIKDCTNSDAIQFFGTHHTVSNCEIYNVIETDNDINHCDIIQTFTNHAGGNVTTTNFLFEKNYIHDCVTQVFYISNTGTNGTVSDITIRNNIYANIGLMGQVSTNVENVHVYNNVFYKVGYLYYLPGTSQKSYATHAISVYEGSTEIKNNAFLECGDEPSKNYKGWFYTGGTTHNNNYVAGPSYAAKNYSETGLVNGGDPKFTNEARYDFTISEDTSVLIDAGTILASFSTDKDGNPRPQSSAWEIGAYEFDYKPAAPRNLRIVMVE